MPSSCEFQCLELMIREWSCWPRFSHLSRCAARLWMIQQISIFHFSRKCSITRTISYSSLDKQFAQHNHKIFIASSNFFCYLLQMRLQKLQAVWLLERLWRTFNHTDTTSYRIVTGRPVNTLLEANKSPDAWMTLPEKQQFSKLNQFLNSVNQIMLLNKSTTWCE